MADKKYINVNTPVYISYASNEDKYPHIADVTDQLCERFNIEDILCRISSRDVKCGSINDFEIEIGYARCVIVVYNNKYFRSQHCMNEYAKIVETTKDETSRKIILINSDGINLDDDTISDLIEYWENEEAMDSQFQKTITQSSIDHQYYHNSKTSFCIQNINKFFSRYSRKKTNADNRLEENVLIEIVADIKDFYNKIEFTPSAPHFSFPISNNLLARENEEDALFKSISNNRILNLVGVGGSGKSSLAYLCIKKYVNYFSEIIYATINNNIEDDFVEQINKTLKLKLERNPFNEIIAYLQENYKSGKPNLIVWDINETTNKDNDDTIINAIIKNEHLTDGWKFLILSRENIDTRGRITTYNLNEKQDVVFLKQLFLSKAGERYNDFGDFTELCNIVYFNPLLTEQLGIYLKKMPRILTVADIRMKVEGDAFKDKYMRGMSAVRHDETIVSFLKKLISFTNDLSDTEQKLLRHFVLWQADYIGYDVIVDLLQGVFESEDELIDTLTSLVERSILMTSNDKTLSYKLHGLLAASILEQFKNKIENEDYNKYQENIKRIIEYDYYKLLPYVDCIGNSLCKYDITTDFVLIDNVAKKYSKMWKADYAKCLFDKVIIILSAKKEDPAFRHFLASTYHNIGTLQGSYYGEYESAKSNFMQAIKLYEQLPKNNLKFQNDLVSSYNNIANLQDEYFKNYELAESYYLNIIKIREQLSKDNPMFQNDLADAYFNLANSQMNHLRNCESAKCNYEKAISIKEQLPKDNLEFQNTLAMAYCNLAFLNKNSFADYKSAESNYQKAISIIEQLPKDNPMSQNILANAYNGLALLQSEIFNEYGAAKINTEKAISICEQLPKDNPKFQNDLSNFYFNLAVLLFNRVLSFNNCKIKDVTIHILSNAQQLVKKSLTINSTNELAHQLDKDLSVFLQNMIVHQNRQ